MLNIVYAICLSGVKFPINVYFKHPVYLGKIKMFSRPVPTNFLLIFFMNNLLDIQKDNKGEGIQCHEVREKLVEIVLDILLK